MQRRPVAEEKQRTEKHGPFSVVEAHRGHGLPEVAPAASEHACTDGLARGQERKHAMEEIVRQGADAVLPWHSVEQLTATDLLGGWTG